MGSNRREYGKNPPQLLNEASIKHAFDVASAGDGGVELMGVYASPSKRLLSFPPVYGTLTITPFALTIISFLLR